MIRIYACGIATKVVDTKTIRDRPNKNFVGRPVRLDLAATDLSLAVSLFGFPALPDPARRRVSSVNVFGSRPNPFAPVSALVDARVSAALHDARASSGAPSFFCERLHASHASGVTSPSVAFFRSI
jgi:hypothetical protein